LGRGKKCEEVEEEQAIEIRKKERNSRIQLKLSWILTCKKTCDSERERREKREREYKHTHTNTHEGEKNRNNRHKTYTEQPLHKDTDNTHTHLRIHTYAHTTYLLAQTHRAHAHVFSQFTHA
jgi:hypothetical protein